MEVFYPSSTRTRYRFPWSVQELAVGEPADVLGLTVTSTEVIHSSGAPSTALRIGDGKKTFAYSGDTQWTDALLAVAAGADLFVVECYDYDRELTGHMNWALLRQRLPDFKARRIMLTHMNPSMLSRVEEARAAGVLVAEDGLVLDL
jgi:ribonuclease BN (tRNA processing enzyme)